MLALHQRDVSTDKGRVSWISQGDPTTVLKVISVWRSLFFAIGAMLIIVGVECLLIDSATLSGGQTEAVAVTNSWFGPQQTLVVEPERVVRPPEWMRWSLIASGAVVLLYAFTLPRRWGSHGGGEG
jgi:hypothetical protein